MKDLQRAREVLQAATELHPLSVDLWLSRVEFEVSVDTPFAEIQAILDVAVQVGGGGGNDIITGVNSVLFLCMICEWNKSRPVLF